MYPHPAQQFKKKINESKALSSNPSPTKKKSKIINDLIEDLNK
jgi:hypothetical protein